MIGFVYLVIVCFVAVGLRIYISFEGCLFEFVVLVFGLDLLLSGYFV